jgi:DNA helicase-2/ATP-dependent DNA helicase PcrA
LHREPDGQLIEYDHLAVDEAQDLSAVEIKVLVEAAAHHGEGGDRPLRSVTLAGDVSQRLVFDNAFHGWRELLSDLGLGDVSISPLELSYRSTEEVMRFARRVLGPLAIGEEPAARAGAPVEVHRFEAMGEAVGFLAEALRSLSSREPTASVALIARYPGTADAYYEALGRAEVPSLRRVRRQDFAFAPGIDVTDVAQVKGLEFDYVVLLDVTAANYPDSVETRHLLHIGATRAAHQLWLIAISAPSALVPADLLVPVEK